MFKNVLSRASRCFSYKTHYHGNNVSLIPPNHNYTLIWLPGIGGTAHDWTGFFDGDKKFQFVNPETTKIVLLTPPIRELSANQNVHTPAWYDIMSFEDVFTESKKDRPLFYSFGPFFMKFTHNVKSNTFSNYVKN